MFLGNYNRMKQTPTCWC